MVAYSNNMNIQQYDFTCCLFYSTLLSHLTNPENTSQDSLTYIRNSKAPRHGHRSNHHLLPIHYATKSNMAAKVAVIKVKVTNSRQHVFHVVVTRLCVHHTFSHKSFHVYVANRHMMMLLISILLSECQLYAVMCDSTSFYCTLVQVQSGHFSYCY